MTALLTRRPMVVGLLVTAVVAAAVAGVQLWLADLLDVLWRSDGSLDGGSAVPGGFISVARFAAGAVHAAVLLAGVNGWDDDHYSTGADLATWLCLSLYAVGAAAFGAVAGRARRPDSPGRAGGTALFGWGAVVLATAVLDWGVFGVVAAAVGTLAGATGRALGRGRPLSVRAGVLAAAAGPVALFLLGLAGVGTYIGGPALPVEASGAAELPVAVLGAVVGGAALLGAFARGPRAITAAAALATVVFGVLAVAG